ncbi:LacI family DNA-binding transcriptional regulator [Lachnospiraceae bacterium YH-ros2228]
MKATIRDVAREAGVSISTVSKVMNHWKTISQETVDRVQDAATKLGYTPNARAVNFARGNTHNVIYLSDLKRGAAYQNPHLFDIMCGVFSSLAKNGYTMTLMDISNEDHPNETIENIIKEKSADGIVIHGSVINQKVANLIVDHQFPHIVIGHPDFDNRLCWIDTNHALAGQHAAAYLIKRKALPAVFIAGRKTDFISKERENGFRKYLRHNGYSLQTTDVAYTDSSWEMAYQATKEFLNRSTIPKAIVTENNTLAVGAARALRELSDEKSNEIVFLTFDIYPYTTILDPRPDVIDINVYELGIQVGEMIIRKINNPTLMIQSYSTLPEII